MINLMLDTDQLDKSHPDVQIGLDIDLRRMERLDHSDKPSGADVLIVTARNGIWHDSIIYTFQYGRRTAEGFEPQGQPQERSHESLPYLN